MARARKRILEVGKGAVNPIFPINLMKHEDNET